MPKIITVTEGYVYKFMCPGCEEYHTFPCNGKTLHNGHTWNFNMDMDRPTVTPSLNIAWGKEVDPNWSLPDDIPETDHFKWSGRCHSTVTDGKIFFHGDTTHGLKLQSVILPEV